MTLRGDADFPAPVGSPEITIVALEAIDDATYELEQRAAIEAWQTRSPSLTAKTLAWAFTPIGWAVQRLIPHAGVEGALRAADWMAHHTLAHGWMRERAGVSDIAQLQDLPLRELDQLAASFHKWQLVYVVAEGSAAGAIGLPGIAVDIPALIGLTLRTIRGVGLCYGFDADTDEEREFVLGILSTVGANTVFEKEAALVFLKELRTVVAKQAVKAMAATTGTAQGVVAAPSVARKLGVRSLARRLGVNLTKRKLMQAAPAVGAVVGAAVNYKFIDDVAWASRYMYQKRWLERRESGGEGTIWDGASN